jgi:protein TonB
MSGSDDHRPLAAALAASALLHALAMALLWLAAPGADDATAPVALLPVQLVSLPGRGGGPPGDGEPAPPPPPPPAEAPRPAPAPAVVSPAPRRLAATPEPPPAPAGTAAVRPDTGSGGTRETPGAVSGAAGTGTGDGSGGDGTGGAGAAYGTNPRPPYPLAARRLGLEGRVLLDVLVRPDGRAAEVRVRESSGHRILDDSAADTVRTRWRFVPARRGGQPVESRVTVPIRFELRRG